MSTKRRQFSDEFKRQVLDEVASGKSIAATIRQHRLSKNSVYEWQAAEAAKIATVSVPQSELSGLQDRVAMLERMVGQLTVENDILKKVDRLQKQRESQTL